MFDNNQKESGYAKCKSFKRPIVDEVRSSINAPYLDIDIVFASGLLTAVACGPELVLPDEWLKAVAQESNITWRNRDHRLLVQKYLKEIFNQISTELLYVDGESETDAIFSPLPVLKANSSHLFLAMVRWCEGFLKGVSLRSEAWDPLLESDAKELMIPFLAMGVENKEALAPALLKEKRYQEMLLNLIPQNVVAINRFWAERSAWIFSQFLFDENITIN